MEIGDAAAVALARTGDSDGFRLLVERHSRKVFRLAFRLTGNEQDAEDVVQETFLRAFRGLDRFDERALVGSWLYRIASNYALDLLRNKKMRAGPSLSAETRQGRPMEEAVSSPQPGPERELESERLNRRIGEALDLLTPQERVAFSLRHFEGRSIEEISVALQVGANATKQAVFRAVQKMRRALADAPAREQR
jgi:RNA polymerase sigma-70 factor (ECF subfamily)